jgi:hypothetical protein
MLADPNSNSPPVWERRPWKSHELKDLGWDFQPLLGSQHSPGICSSKQVSVLSGFTSSFPLLGEDRVGEEGGDLEVM